MEESEKAIIFIALSNQILQCNYLLENEIYANLEEKKIIQHLQKSCESLLDKYTPEEPSSKPIQRPTF